MYLTMKLYANILRVITLSMAQYRSFSRARDYASLFNVNINYTFELTLPLKLVLLVTLPLQHCTQWASTSNISGEYKKLNYFVYLLRVLNDHAFIYVLTSVVYRVITYQISSYHAFPIFPLSPQYKFIIITNTY